MMVLPKGTDMTELEALKERIRILEQRSRRLRNVGIGLALFVIAGFAFAQQRPSRNAIVDVIEAKKFVLKDDKGVERASLSLLGGSAELNMHEGYVHADSISPSGTRPLSIRLSADGLMFQGETSLATINSEHILLADIGGNLRTALGSTTLGSSKTGAVKTQPASLILLDKQGKVLFRAP